MKFKKKKKKTTSIPASPTHSLNFFWQLLKGTGKDLSAAETGGDGDGDGRTTTKDQS